MGWLLLRLPGYYILRDYGVRGSTVGIGFALGGRADLGRRGLQLQPRSG